MKCVGVCAIKNNNRCIRKTQVKYGPATVPAVVPGRPSAAQPRTAGCSPASAPRGSSLEPPGNGTEETVIHRLGWSRQCFKGASKREILNFTAISGCNRMASKDIQIKQYTTFFF